MGRRDGREYAENKRARDDARRVGTFGFRDDRASRLYWSRRKAADKKPKPSKPKRLKNSKAKGAEEPRP